MDGESDLRRLVEDWNEALLDGLEDEDEQVTTFLRPGATPQAIAELEERLGVRLPPSYRAFLALSDGAVTKPVWRAPLTPRQPGEEAGLLRTDQVGWLRDKDPDTVEIWSEIPETDLPDEVYLDYTREQDCAYLRVSHLPDLLQVSCFEWQCAILLNPRVQQPDGEWEAWDFAFTNPGAFRYRSFAELLRWDTVEAREEHAAELSKASGYVPSLESAFAEIEARHPSGPGNGRAWEIEQMPDPERSFDRLMALTDHPDPDVRRLIWKAIARVRTPAALDALVTMARSEDDLWQVSTAMYRLLDDPDPRAHDIALDLLARAGVARTMVANSSGLDLLWEGWLKHHSTECLDRLVACGDPRGDEPALALLADPGTPATAVAGLVGAAWDSRRPTLAPAVRAVADQGRVDRDRAVIALISMGALDDASALIPAELLADPEQGELWRGFADMIERERETRIE